MIVVGDTLGRSGCGRRFVATAATVRGRNRSRTFPVRGRRSNRRDPRPPRGRGSRRSGPRPLDPRRRSCAELRPVRRRATPSQSSDPTPSSWARASPTPHRIRAAGAWPRRNLHGAPRGARPPGAIEDPAEQRDRPLDAERGQDLADGNELMHPQRLEPGVVVPETDACAWRYPPFPAAVRLDYTERRLADRSRAAVRSTVISANRKIRETNRMNMVFVNFSATGIKPFIDYAGLPCSLSAENQQFPLSARASEDPPRWGVPAIGIGAIPCRDIACQGVSGNCWRKMAVLDPFDARRL